MADAGGGVVLLPCVYVISRSAGDSDASVTSSTCEYRHESVDGKRNERGRSAGGVVSRTVRRMSELGLHVCKPSYDYHYRMDI